MRTISQKWLIGFVLVFLTQSQAAAQGFQACPPAGYPLAPKKCSSPPTRPPAQINFLVDASGKLLNAMVAKPVQETRPVRESEQDSETTGTSWTQAKVYLELIPNPHQAVADLVTVGSTRSEAVTMEELIKAYTTTNIRFAIRKRIWFDFRGVHSYRAIAQVKATIFLREIHSHYDAPDWPGTYLFTSLFKHTKGGQEILAEDKAQKSMTREMDEKMTPELEKLQKGWHEGVQNLNSLGVHLDRVYLSTTQEKVQGRLAIFSPGQGDKLSLPLEAPATADLAIRLHQSLINGLVHANLAGKTFTFAQLLELVEKVRPVMQKGQDKSGEDPLVKEFGKIMDPKALKEGSLTFARKDPIALSFADQEITVNLNWEKLKMGTLAVPALKIAFTYKLDHSSGKLTARRPGPVKVEFADPKKGADFQNQITRTILERILEMFLKDRLDFPDLDLPEAVRPMGPLVFQRGEARNGWLLVAWKKKG